ncbi:MAG: transposase family protein [Dehalococcoidales bacterium]|nr:transposase family protein [Dehalococcoidales bacterium]
MAGYKVLITHEIVGYTIGERLTKHLVRHSLLRAMAARRPVKEPLHHSDRDSQYCSSEYRNILAQFGLEVSMSGNGNCWIMHPLRVFGGRGNPKAGANT